jgi:hypothetical protein
LLAVPIEGIFQILKTVDFRERELKEPTQIKNTSHDALTKKQYLLAQVSEHILSLSRDTIKNVYANRFKRLVHFI